MADKEKIYEPGKTITLRFNKDLTPSDLRYLNELRNQEENFNKTAVNLLLEAVEKHMRGNDQQVVIPLPQTLTTEQKERLASADVRNLIGQLVNLLLANPSASISPLVGQMQSPTQEALVAEKPKKPSKSKKFASNVYD